MASILIIDDERAIRNVLKDILNNEGYTTAEVNDGEAGLAQFAAGKWRHFVSG